jgi:hypothetical protein
MLTITSEARLLQPLAAGEQSTLQIAMNLTGVFLDATPDQVPDDYAVDRLYPWRWQLPEQLRIWWLIEDDTDPAAVSYRVDGMTDIDLKTIEDQDAPNDDVEKVKSQYEANLNRLLRNSDGTPREGALCSSLNGAGNGNGDELVLGDDPPPPDSPTHELRGAIAQLAQKLPPFNQALGMVFLAEATLDVPPGANCLIAAPIGGDWWQQPTTQIAPGDAVSVEKSSVKISYPAVAGKLPNGFTFFASIEYFSADALDGPQDPNAHLQVTKNGVFVGKVCCLEVSDVDDWMPGIHRRLAPYFDLPAYLARYLNRNAIRKALLPDDLPLDQEDAYRSYLEAVEDYLIRVMRDALGYGWRDHPDGTTLIRWVLNGLYPDKDASFQEQKARELSEKLRNLDSSVDWKNSVKAVIEGGQNDPRWIRIGCPFLNLPASTVLRILPAGVTTWSSLLSDALLPDRPGYSDAIAFRFGRENAATDSPIFLAVTQGVKLLADANEREVRDYLTLKALVLTDPLPAGGEAKQTILTATASLTPIDVNDTKLMLHAADDTWAWEAWIVEQQAALDAEADGSQKTLVAVGRVGSEVAHWTLHVSVLRKKRERNDLGFTVLEQDIVTFQRIRTLLQVNGDLTDGQQREARAAIGQLCNLRLFDLWKAEVTRWLDEWNPPENTTAVFDDNFHEHLLGPGLPGRILKAQFANVNAFGDLPDIAGDKKAAFLGALEALAESQNLRTFELETLVERTRTTLFNASAATGGELARAISNNLITAVQSYAAERKGPGTDFYPQAVADTDPFANPPAALVDPPSWAGFTDFIREYINRPARHQPDPLLPHEGQPPIETKAENAIMPGREEVCDVPPPVRITVDLPAAHGADGGDADLNNLLSGHLLFMRRADANGNFSGDWRCLNRVKALVSEPAAELSRSLLIPAFLPETDGLRRACITISNDKLSLITGHQENLVDEPKIEHARKDQSVANEEVGDSGIRYSFDRGHLPHALWYGHDYEFLGFVALNSGVLPPPLRCSEDEWNVPANEFPDLPATEATRYPHLRRVGIGAVRIEPTAHPKPANGLIPLASELPEWRGVEKSIQEANENAQNMEQAARVLEETLNKADKQERAWFLLAHNSDDAPYKCTTLTFELRLPTTDFWNWFAWVGEGPTHEEKNTILAWDLQNRAKGVKGWSIADPAVERSFEIWIEELFSQSNAQTQQAPIKQRVTIPEGNNDPIGSMHSAARLIVNLTEKSSVEAVVSDHTITVGIPPGRVLRVKIHAIVKKSLFNSADGKFHDWMLDKVAPIKDGLSKDEQLTSPVELWFETPGRKIADDLANQALFWQALSAEALPDETHLVLNRAARNLFELDQFKRLTVAHQVWHWNGRVDASELLKDLDFNPEPGDPKSTKAMEWEAWAFSDRPDNSSLIHNEPLPYSKEVALLPKVPIFRDHRPGEQKALYYRFAVTAHSRYELLGGEHDWKVTAKLRVDGVDNPWFRYLRPCTRLAPLPRPSLRFLLPLTQAGPSDPDHHDTVAPVLIVLDDHWFAEAGLAEGLEVRVREVRLPSDPTKSYVLAGPDPILTGKALEHAEVPSEKVPEGYASIKPVGPIGLTFDLAANTPRLRGCCFTLSLPKSLKLQFPGVGDASGSINIDEAIAPFFMMNIEVRRVIREPFLEGGLQAAAANLNSPWSASAWVQFLPDAKMFVPKSWREEARCKGFISLKWSQDDQGLAEDPNLPTFDSTFEERLTRCIIVSKEVTDINGNPSECYLATLLQDASKKWVVKHNAASGHVSLGNDDKGYVRVMLVRRRKDEQHAQNNPFAALFGESVSGSTSFTAVENDPQWSCPISSPAYPFRIRSI